MRMFFLRPVYFIWIIVPAVLYLAFQIFGLPHFIWSYSWQNNGTHDPFARRFYTRCTFIGPYGDFTIHHPRGGKCSWIIFRKNEGDRASG